MNGEEVRVLEARLDEFRKANERYIDLQAEEREKAAHNLRLEMERAVKEGDERLREHITNQVLQINSALESGEKLEMARIREVKELVAGVQREIKLSFSAAQEAITKAETAAKESLKAHNGLIDQMQQKDVTYATKDDIVHVNQDIARITNVQSKFLGALALVAILMPVISGVILYALVGH